MVRVFVVGVFMMGRWWWVGRALARGFGIGWRSRWLGVRWWRRMSAVAVRTTRAAALSPWMTPMSERLLVSG